MKLTFSPMNSPAGTFPKRLIPATLNVKKISIRRAAVFKILPSDMKRVFNRVLRPSEVFTILKSLETLIIRRAVGLKFRVSSRFSFNETRDMITIMKSNLFQLTYQ